MFKEIIIMVNTAKPTATYFSKSGTIIIHNFCGLDFVSLKI